MTDMEIKYWDLVERQRANREQERLKKLDVESQIPLRGAQAQAQKASAAKATAEIGKIEAETAVAVEEIALTIARTDLTKTQKQEAIANTIEKYTKAGLNLSKIGETIENMFLKPKEVANDALKAAAQAAKSLFSKK